VRRDSIFYQLFQQSPSLLFEILEHQPANAAQYTFDSVAVKEPTFTIDGVFLPPKQQKNGIVYFCEIQFQKDELLYERLFGESMLYFYRHRRRFEDWRAVVIYPSRSKEQTKSQPYEDLIRGSRVHRIYLDELGDIETVPIGQALMMLTNTNKRQAPVVARQVLARSQTSGTKAEIRAIMEILTTIMTYKFTKLSRKEVETMLGIDSLKETRFYQEAKEDGVKEGHLSAVLRLLQHKFKKLNAKVITQISKLSLEQLDELMLALLNFESIEDLKNWLSQNS
jgi:predicted transposase/invertase (TIGR01784 family)